MGRRVTRIVVPVAIAGSLLALLLSGCDNVILRDEIKAILTGPEIVVKQAGVSIDSGENVDIGTYGQDVDKSFSIENSGLQTLRLTGTPLVNVTGTDTAAFWIQEQPTIDAVDPGNTADFVLRFSPSAIGGQGIRTVDLSIPNNDFDEGSFSFSVTADDNC